MDDSIISNTSHDQHSVADIDQYMACYKEWWPSISRLTVCVFVGFGERFVFLKFVDFCLSDLDWRVGNKSCKFLVGMITLPVTLGSLVGIPYPNAIILMVTRMGLREECHSNASFKEHVIHKNGRTTPGRK